MMTKAEATGTAHLDTYLATRRPLIDSALMTWLPAADQCAPRLREAMRYSLAAGGKRLRPVLTLAAAEALLHDANVAHTLALPAACALEYIHTYSLIHDDLPSMDNDTLRRGLPTSHVVFGEALAILAGDALLTEAFRIVALEPRDVAGVSEAMLHERRGRVVATIAVAAGALGMVGGQVLDLEAESGRRDGVQQPAPGADRDAQHGELRRIHASKTGALIRAAATSGAIMAGGDTAAVAAIDAYAADLGLAFQIVDDVLDVEGDAATLGKTAGKDAAAGKLTYPVLFGIEGSRRMAAEAVERACGSLAVAGIGGWLPDLARLVVNRQS
jgi:geranylgeranyl diphosphate synthase type II